MAVTLPPLQVMPVQLLLHGSPRPIQVARELLHLEVLVLKVQAALIEANAAAAGDKGGEGGKGGGAGGLSCMAYAFGVVSRRRRRAARTVMRARAESPLDPVICIYNSRFHKV